MVVVSVSPQARASIAAKFNLSVQEVIMSGHLAGGHLVQTFIPFFVGSREVSIFLQGHRSSLCV